MQKKIYAVTENDMGSIFMRAIRVLAKLRGVEADKVSFGKSKALHFVIDADEYTVEQIERDYRQFLLEMVSLGYERYHELQGINTTTVSLLKPMPCQQQ